MPGIGTLGDLQQDVSQVCDFQGFALWCIMFAHISFGAAGLISKFVQLSWMGRRSSSRYGMSICKQTLIFLSETPGTDRGVLVDLLCCAFMHLNAMVH